MRSSSTVPVASLADALTVVLSERTGMSVKDYRAYSLNSSRYPGSAQLAKEAGVSQRSLGRILRKSPGVCDIDIAERLIRAAGGSEELIKEMEKADSRPTCPDWAYDICEDFLHIERE